MSAVNFTFSFQGKASDNHVIDLYDVSQALIGFQRSLALTVHAVLNDEVITQAPSLRGARIVTLPPEPGSWRIPASVITVASGLYMAGTAPKDTPVGHFVRSAYDYVVSQTLGFHVDFEKTLGQQYEQLSPKLKKTLPEPTQSRFDSVIEKIDNSVLHMHRPIIYSKTASSAVIYATIGNNTSTTSRKLDGRTYSYVAYTKESTKEQNFYGVVTSFNLNTFKGRIFLAKEKRPIPFELSDLARDTLTIRKITKSLDNNANKISAPLGFTALTRTSRTKILKNLLILDVA